MSGSLFETMAAGLPGAFDSVLQNCRFEGYGTQAYGGEAIREVFRSQAQPLADMIELSGPTFAASIATVTQGKMPVGMFADLHAGRVTRLWVLGEVHGGAEPPPRVAVPLDPDLDQRGARLAFEASLFPDLSPDAAARIESLGAAWIERPPADVAQAMTRARFTVIRAGFKGDTVAALLRIEGRARDRQLGCYALLIADEAVRLVVDRAGLAIAAPVGAVLRADTVG